MNLRWLLDLLLFLSTVFSVAVWLAVMKIAEQISFIYKALRL